MLRARRPALLVLAAALGLPSCDVDFRRQVVRLRHDPATDTADLLLLYGGLTAPDAARGANAVERLLGGDREFIVASWPLHFRIDDWAEDARETLADPAATAVDRRLAEGTLALSERLTLVDRGLLEDGSGELSGWQHFRLRDTSRVLEQLNDMISWSLLAAVAAGDLEPDDDVDARTITLWTDHAERGDAWFALAGGRIVVDVPLSRAVARRGLAALIEDLAREEDHVLVRLLAALAADVDALVLADERLHVELAATAEAGRVFAWNVENPALAPDDALEQELASRGVTVRDDVTVEDLRRRLR